MIPNKHVTQKFYVDFYFFIGFNSSQCNLTKFSPLMYEYTYILQHRDLFHPHSHLHIQSVPKNSTELGFEKIVYIFIIVNSDFQLFVYNFIGNGPMQRQALEAENPHLQVNLEVHVPAVVKNHLATTISRKKDFFLKKFC